MTNRHNARPRHNAQYYVPNAEEVEAMREAGFTPAAPSGDVGEDIDADDGLAGLAPPWPARPVEAYHGLAGELVNAVEYETEADPTAILAQLLVALGNAAGRNAHFAIGPRKQFCNLLMVVVGRSSRARKGTAWSWVEHALEKADRTWSANCKINGLSTKEGLIRQLQDNHDKRLLAIEEELGGVLGAMERQGNTLSACLRQSFDTGNLRVATRGDPLRVDGAHMSLIGHITAADLSAQFSEQMAANGVGNRCLWICARRSRLLPHGGKVPDLRCFTRPIGKALTAAQSAGQYVLSGPASALWTREYARLTSDEPGLYGELTSRSETIVQRLALIYALLDRATQIEMIHLRAALSLWRFAAACVGHVFGRTPASAMAVALQRALAAAGVAGLNRREAFAALGGRVGSEDLRKAIQELVRLDQIEIRPQKPHGVRMFGKELPDESCLRAIRATRRRSP